MQNFTAFSFVFANFCVFACIARIAQQKDAAKIFEKFFSLRREEEIAEIIYG